MLLSFAGFFALLGMGSLGGFRGTPPPPDALRRLVGVEDIAYSRTKGDCSISFRLAGEPGDFTYGCSMPRASQVRRTLVQPDVVVAVARPSPAHPWAPRPEPEVWAVEQRGQPVVTYAETAGAWEASRADQARFSGLWWVGAALCAVGSVVAFRRGSPRARLAPAPA